MEYKINIKKCLLSILLVLVVSFCNTKIYCQTTQKIENMKTIEFIPKEFNDVKLGYYETSSNLCSPIFPGGIPIDTIAINTPQKIVFNRYSKDFMFVVPVCIAYMISDRRGLKYNHLSPKIVHIRKNGEDIIYSNEIIDKDMQDEYPEFPSGYEEEENERLALVEDAQKYSDEELKYSQFAGGGYMNVNLMEYIDIPLESGKHEIWMSFSGLESNRAIVEIVIEGEVITPDSQPVKVEPTKFIPEDFEKIDLESMESEKCRCSPNYPHILREINALKINAPEKIFFSGLDKNFTPILPVCIAHSTSYLRTLKYHSFSEKTIYIKPENGDIEYFGHYFDKRAVNETPEASDSFLTAEELQQRQQEIEKAQKLSDQDLNKGSCSEGFLNVNAFNYVDMPIKSGKYEIWLTHCGLESNRAIVEIIVEGEEEALDSQPVKEEVPNKLPDMDIEEEDLPKI